MEELKFNIEVNELNVDIVLEGLCHELEAKLTELQNASEGLRNAESIDIKHNLKFAKFADVIEMPTNDLRMPPPLPDDYDLP
jgi:hypothetical protein